MSTAVTPQAPATAPAAPSGERDAVLYDLFHACALDVSGFAAAIAADLANAPEPAITELGCGTGVLALRLLREIPRATYLGIDETPAMLRRFAIKAGRREPRPSARLKVLGNLRRTGAAPSLTSQGPADALVLCRFLQTVPLQPPSPEWHTRASMLQVARQMVKPGGHVYVIEDTYGETVDEQRTNEAAWEQMVAETLASRADAMAAVLPALDPDLARAFQRRDRLGVFRAVRRAIDRGQERQPLPVSTWCSLFNGAGIPYRAQRHATLANVWMFRLDR